MNVCMYVCVYMASLTARDEKIYFIYRESIDNYLSDNVIPLYGVGLLLSMPRMRQSRHHLSNQSTYHIGNIFYISYLFYSYLTYSDIVYKLWGRFSI